MRKPSVKKNFVAETSRGRNEQAATILVLFSNKSGDKGGGGRRWWANRIRLVRGRSWRQFSD